MKRIDLYKISFIGSGNLAYRLSIALKKAGHSVEFIYSRDPKEGEKLSYILNKDEIIERSNFNFTKYSNNLEALLNSQLIIIAVSDNATGQIIELLNRYKSNNFDNIPAIVHCSGANSIDILQNSLTNNIGVIYPLMTLSKTKPVDFKIVPFFLESSSDYLMNILQNICFSLGSEYTLIDSNQRLKLHLAAVYISNFINYLCSISFEMAKPNHISLLPLAIETIRKAFLYENPKLVQTGPAIREDFTTIEKHLDILSDNTPEKEVYQLITKLIIDQKKETNV